MERTFVMIKPDGVDRGLVGEIISRIENKGLKLLNLKLICASSDILENHYMEHRNKPFFQDLVDSMKDKSVLAMVVEGENSIKLMRIMVGDKDPLCAFPGTIRGDYAFETTRNLIHASDSLEAAEREIKIWFGDKL
ncbi:nucleoside-diphosphate kinase [Gudongella oleilytica]|uniref:nucleoside-diphosphate kinase n=1 Tax=Gudongella oleilytica TaxID=1582259 RepID=UPI000FF88931|nr:nucleoside-diphosphate kinase [Gudongella oleilytica]